MSDEPDDVDSYPDTLGSSDGDVHFGGDAQSFLSHWLGKLGFETPDGGALLVGEGPSITILHPETGEMLSPMQIAKMAKAAKMRSVQ